MRQSKALIQTLREVPRDADVISQQLMMRAGMLQKVAAGIYSYLPLAVRSIRKFEDIVREELAKDGCQELLMPMVQPAELWQESTRWQFYGQELLRFKDRKEADYCLGPTHEEVITDIVRRSIKSYRQLPISLFQIQGKFRDEIRPRFGLMRGREFIMKDGYSFHVDDADADREYWAMFSAYKRIFARIGREIPARGGRQRCHRRQLHARVPRAGRVGRRRDPQLQRVRLHVERREDRGASHPVPLRE